MVTVAFEANCSVKGSALILCVDIILSSKISGGMETTIYLLSRSIRNVRII